MKGNEILEIAKPLIEKMDNAGLKISDIKHLSLYRDYKELESQSHKGSYIIATLSVKYSVTERYIFKILERMNRLV